MRNTKLITISLPPDLYEKAGQRAKKEDRTRSGLFREALRRYLEQSQSLPSSPKGNLMKTKKAFK